jgi:N-succinyldiaminopimelate aminotransferase
MSLLTQRASAVAWSDEEHVRANRALYRQKLDAMLPIIQGALPEVSKPEASFYLWMPTPIDDREFALRLFEAEHVDVLPGRFLSRPGPDGFDPGAGHVRAAFVCPLKDCVEAAERIARFATTLG